jgi:hypothetical protein
MKIPWTPWTCANGGPFWSRKEKTGVERFGWSGSCVCIGILEQILVESWDLVARGRSVCVKALRSVPPS